MYNIININLIYIFVQIKIINIQISKINYISLKISLIAALIIQSKIQHLQKNIKLYLKT